MGMLLDEVVTRSAAFAEVLETARRVAQTDVAVLLVGETGSGKDFLAELIHEAGARRSGPFLKIDAASIPTSLAESELFGYEKGAFSDAVHAKAGKLQMAEGGTLYLDGVHHLTVSVQSKLLRFAQERIAEPLGGQESYSVDCRLISSCGNDLRACLKEGQIREDLYYRLAGVTIALPPLRDRTDDIDLLVASLLKEFAEKYRKKVELSDDALRMLKQYHWPGNVRELKNVLEQAVIRANDTIRRSHFELGHSVIHPNFFAFASEKGMSLQELEKVYIAEVLRKTRGHNGKAARILGINRKTLLIKRRKYGLDKEDP